MKGLGIGTRVHVLPFDEIPKETCCYDKRYRTFCNLDEAYINMVNGFDDLEIWDVEKELYGGSYALRNMYDKKHRGYFAYDMVILFNEEEIECGNGIDAFLSELGGE